MLRQSPWVRLRDRRFLMVFFIVTKDAAIATAEGDSAAIALRGRNIARLGAGTSRLVHEGGNEDTVQIG